MEMTRQHNIIKGAMHDYSIHFQSKWYQLLFLHKPRPHANYTYTRILLSLPETVVHKAQVGMQIINKIVVSSNG